MKRNPILTLILAAPLLMMGCAERQDAVSPGSGTGALTCLGRTAVRGTAKDVAVVDDTLAYVADEPYGISIYNLSDPANPQLVDSLDLNSPKVRLISVDQSGRFAAIQEDNDIRVYDLNTKQLLFFIGSTNHVEIQLDFSGDTLSIYRCDNDAGDGFNCERIVDPGSAPNLVFSTQYQESPNSLYGFALAPNDIAYICRNNTGFAVVDYSVPDNASLIGEMNTPGRVRDAALSGDILCLAAGYEGLLTVDVGDTTLLGALIIENATDIELVEVNGNRAYLQDAWDGIFAVDISDPANPVLIGSLETSDPNNFCLSGDLLLVADEDMGLVVGQILY